MANKNSVGISDNERMYSTYYADKSWNEFRRVDAMRYLSYLTNHVKFSVDDNVLEVGCGTAEFGTIIRERYGSEIYGLDMNSVAVAQARKQGVHAYKRDIERTWPFPEGKFKHVIATQIIEHIVNPDFMMTESKRVLKRGGYFIVATPNLGAWFNRVLVPLGYQPFFTEVSTVDKTFGLGFTRSLTPVRKPLGHLRCFTLGALVDMLAYYGFTEIYAKGATVSYFPKYLSPVDQFFSMFPSLSTDLLVVARRP